MTDPTPPKIVPRLTDEGEVYHTWEVPHGANTSNWTAPDGSWTVTPGQTLHVDWEGVFPIEQWHSLTKPRPPGGGEVITYRQQCHEFIDRASEGLCSEIWRMMNERG